MAFAKRIFLFLLINLLVVITISTVLSLLNVKPYLTAHGLNLSSLLIFCLIWGMGGALISLFLSRTIAKWAMRVRLIHPHDSQEASLLRVVEKLSRDAGLPVTPQVGIFASPDANAFATGPSKKRALVAVSTGLLQKMSPEEVEAVLGHEITHIANGDMVTMTLLQGVINAFVMFLARVLAYALSGMGKDRRPSSGSFYLLTFVFEILFMILGSLVTAWFSRKREFRADKGGATLSSPRQMIQALQSLGSLKQTPSEHPALNAFMIRMPAKHGLLRLFATHPPIEERIERLRHEF